ncbi:hypothetical protein HUU42_00375 [bacterium]|nr:hypothetical protein [bacterium]
MRSPLEFINEIKKIWPQRSTLKGLIWFWISLILFLSVLFTPIFFILKESELVSSKDFRSYVLIYIFCTAICHLLLFCFWLYWRLLPSSHSMKTTIYFSPHSDEECTDLIHKLYENFCNDLKKRGLSNRIVPYILPQNQTILNPRDAVEKLATTGARLAIHGEIEKGMINGEEASGFKKISFTVKHRAINEDEAKILDNDFRSAFEDRRFFISEKNSFIEKSVVIDNLSEVSCFFIAIAMYLDNDLNGSEELFEHLFHTIKVKTKTDSRLSSFQSSINRFLSLVYSERLYFLYSKSLMNNITNPRLNDEARKCLMLLKKMEQLDTLPLIYYLQYSIINFHFGNIIEAERIINDAKKTFKNDMIPFFSSAFLNLWKGDYAAAVKDYIKLCRWEYENNVIYSVISFLLGIVELHPEKHQIKFAVAFLNDRFLDKNQAIIDYQAFIDATENAKDYQILRNYAISQLNFLIKNK